MENKNPMNVKDPILEHHKEIKLKNGWEVTVKGFVFDHPVFENGNPPVHNMVTIVTKSNIYQPGSPTEEEKILIRERTVIGIAFYADPMSKEELEDKVENVSEEPEAYLSPDFLLKM